MTWEGSTLDAVMTCILLAPLVLIGIVMLFGIVGGKRP